MGVREVETGVIEPVVRNVKEFHWRCDKPNCTSTAVTTSKVAPEGWRYHQITGSEYSWWDAIWCKECNESFERSMKKTRTAMRIKDAERRRRKGIEDAKRLLEENNYRVIDPDLSDVQTLE